MKADKILSRYRENRNPLAGICLAAFSLVGDSVAKLMLVGSLPFDQNEARQFVFQRFGYKLFPLLGTYEFGRKDRSTFWCTLFAAKPLNVVEPAENKKNLVQMNANAWLDQDIGKVWAKETIDGKEFLVRSNDDNLGELLNLVSLQASSTARTLQVPMIACKVGDLVDVVTIIDGKPMTVKGTVKAVSSTHCTVSTTDGDLSVPLGSVVRKHITQEESDKVVDYLSQAYNPKNGSFDYGALFKR